MKKLIIFGLVLLALLLALPMGFSALVDDIGAYWTLDNTLTDATGNGNTLSNTGVDFVTGIINESGGWNGDSDTLYVNDASFGSNRVGMSKFAWINPNESGTQLSIMTKYPDASNREWTFFRGTNNKVTLILYNNNPYPGAYVLISSAETVPINEWTYVGFTYDGSNVSLYVNGELSNSSSSFTGSIKTSGPGLFMIGKQQDQTGLTMEGRIDEVGLWNRALTPAEVQELYNDGAGFQYPFIPSAINFDNISANGEPLTDGSLFNTSQLDFEINLSNSSTNAHINTSYFLYNSTGGLINSSQFGTHTLEPNTTLYMAEGNYSIYFFAENNQTNTTTSNYSFSVDLSNPNLEDSIPAEINTYLLNESAYIDFSDDFGLGVSCNITYSSGVSSNCQSVTNISLNGNITYNILVNDSAGRINTSSGTVLVDPWAYFYFEDPSGASIANFTLNGTTYNEYAAIRIYDLGLGNHTLLFEKYGYQTKNISISFTNTSNINLTTMISVALLNIEIYDELESLLSQVVSIDLVGDDFAGSFSTSNGTLSITNITYLPGDYRLTFSSSGYSNNEYFFTHTGYAAVNLATYLINESETLPIKIIIDDIFDDPKDACIVKVKQYFISANDYLIVDMGQTNALGEVIFDLEYDTYYQFVIVCDGVTQTEPGQKITSTPLYIEFSDSDTLTIFEEIPNLSYNINFSNTSNTSGYFRFEYDDLNNIISQGCLKVYRYAYNGNTLIDSQCSSSASATINVNLNFSEGETYIAKGYITYEGSEHFIDEYEKKFPYGDGTWDKGLGLWSTLLITMTFLFMGCALHPFAGIAFAWLALLISMVFGAIEIQYSAIVGIGALIIGVIIFRGNKR